LNPEKASYLQQNLENISNLKINLAKDSKELENSFNFQMVLDKLTQERLSFTKSMLEEINLQEEEKKKKELEKSEANKIKDEPKEIQRVSNQKSITSPNKLKNKTLDDKLQIKKTLPEKFISIEEKSKKNYFIHKRALSKTVDL
jgi:hypothetical protein